MRPNVGLLHRMVRRIVCLLLGLCLGAYIQSLACGSLAWAQSKMAWRPATTRELEEALPARAPVGRERIETEMRTASGIVDQKGHLIAAVVLITAGYAADGKYSHFFLAQSPITVGSRLQLPSGAYVIGWKREENGLMVHFFEAASGVERGAVLARAIGQPVRVESFRIWPPGERSMIQIGRFMLPYSLE